MAGLLPTGGTGYQRPEWDTAAVAGPTERFLASPAGADHTGGGAHGLLGSLLWFGTDYGPGDPMRWSGRAAVRQRRGRAGAARVAGALARRPVAAGSRAVPGTAGAGQPREDVESDGAPAPVGREAGAGRAGDRLPRRTPDRRALRFSVSGSAAIEPAYRTHWVAPELSAAKRERLVERTSRPPDLVVVSPVRGVDLLELRGDR